MIPYGIVINQNRLVMQQALTVWQRKFGILKVTKFIKSAVLFLAVFVVAFFGFSFAFEKEFSIMLALPEFIIDLCLIISFMYFTAIRTVRDYAATTKQTKVQLVLKEEVLEITTEFSKETVPYSEIEMCYEKDFLLTIIVDKNSFPIPVSKVLFEKGNYDIFVSLLKNKMSGRYEKKGDN